MDLYVDKLQTLQSRRIKIIKQYFIDGRKIKSSDEKLLHSETYFQFLKERRKKHLLYMMFNMKTKNPEILDTRDKGIQLRSSSHVRFKAHKLNSEIYIRSPYVRGCSLWKQLPCNIRHAESLSHFKRLLTDDVVVKLQS